MGRQRSSTARVSAASGRRRLPGTAAGAIGSCRGRGLLICSARSSGVNGSGARAITIMIPKPMTLRWGILGCGDVCEVKSGPAFQKASGSALVAVMRRDEEKAADFARRHGVPRFYADADALIADPEVDAVYVATPPS